MVWNGRSLDRGNRMQVMPLLREVVSLERREL